MMDDDFKYYGEYSYFREYPDAPDQNEVMDGMQLAMGSRGASTEQIQKFKGQSVMENITEAGKGMLTVGKGMADIGAAAVKGTVQGFAGLPGDIELIGRGVTAIFNRGGDESKVQAFLRGLQEETILANTEDIKKWLDTNVGKVGKGDNPYETIGEVMAPGGYVKGVKATVKGAKSLAPVAGEMIENYLTKTGVILKAAPDAPGIEVLSAPKLNTPAFKKWFGDSKIVDEKSQPLVVYHGSATGKVEEFKTQGPGRFYGPGAYFAFEPEDAAHYAKNAERRNRGISQTIYPVYLSMKNPMPLDEAMRRKILYRKASDKNWLKTIIPELKIKMTETKYDGFILKDNDGKLISAVVFNPTQIKSVFNKGTFDPKDPRILYGGGAASAGTAMTGEENK
jgi:hypothetical protein